MDKQDELFVVVNKHDKIISYRTRFECHHNRELIHRSVGVVIFNNQGQILLQKRSMQKDLNPGWYTLSAAGHVGKGETYIQSARRELMEELGIKIPLKRKKKYLLETDQESEMTYLFTAKYNGPFFPNKKEVDVVKFADVDRLKFLSSRLTPFALAGFKQLGLLGR